MLSVVVPAHNEQRLLGACLASIRDACTAVGVAHEIVVANDGSTDRTRDIALEQGARVVDVNVRQIAAARNAGARAASGDRLVFVDADCLLDASLLAAALATLDAGAVGGGAGIRYIERVPRWAARATALAVWFMRRMDYAAGSFVFCTRADFEAVGGFDETLFASEEIALSRALKKRGRFIVLPLAIATSARKLEGQTAWSLSWMMLKLLLRGPGGLKRREHLGFWYDRRD